MSVSISLIKICNKLLIIKHDQYQKLRLSSLHKQVDSQIIFVQIKSDNIKKFTLEREHHYLPITTSAVLYIHSVISMLQLKKHVPCCVLRNSSNFFLSYSTDCC